MDVFLKIFLSLSSLLFMNYNLKLGNCCDTLPSTIHIIKEIYSSGSNMLERSCEGEVAVSKCEGSCESKVRPSAIAHSGFIKDCQCCRETVLRLREVTLEKCYDPDGGIITGENGKFLLKLKEPADCKCYKCGETLLNT